MDKDIVFVRKHKEIPDGARPLMSSKGWVSLVDPRDGALYVWDPLSCKNKNSGCRLLKLPSVATLPCVLDVEYDNNCGFSTPSIKKFTLQCYCSKPNHTYEKTSFNVCTNNMLASACFSTAPDDDVNHCIGMAFQGDISPTLHFSEIGGSAWKCLDAPFLNYAQVIASSKKKNVLFALSDAGEIEAWDLRNLSDIKRTFLVESYRLPCFESHLSGPKETDFQGQTYSKKEVDYLLESLEGDLLMVTRHIAEYPDPTRDIPAYHETLKFDVHKLDFGRKKWEKLSCLSDCALFVGINSESFSVRASDFPGIQENSIYFAPADEHSFYGGLDIGVFNLADKEVDRFNQLRAYKAPRGWRSRTRPPFWVAPSATTYL